LPAQHSDEGGFEVQKLIVAGIMAAILRVSFAATTVAAPDNGNTQSFDVSCDAPIGDITVTQIGRGQGDRVVFTEDGQVLVAKRVSGINSATISVEGGPTIPLPPEPFEEGSQGTGFEGRLVSCDFTIEFQDTFTLKKRDLAFLELGTEFLGATATVTGTTTGTAEVVAPGS
jgi:hypothetical protein